MNTSPSQEPWWRRWTIWLAGVLTANLAIAALYLGLSALFVLFTQLKPLEEAWKTLGLTVALSLGLPSLFLVPLFGGLVAGFVWRQLHPRIGPTIIGCFMITLTGLAGATLLLHEGVICLLIVSPLFFIMILVGAMIGRTMFKADRSRLNLTILPLLVLLAAIEMGTRQDQTGNVSDEILIRASPEKIWPLVTAFPDIPNPPRFWLFRIGLPYPMSTTSEGDFVGARRACIFSGNAIFEEVVSELEFEKTLTFEIVKIPPDPELIGHLTPQRGRFSLRDNGDGTTTLTGDTWYTLHVRPLGYFDWWTHHIFRAVHLRVMDDIRRRAEEA